MGGCDSGVEIEFKRAVLGPGKYSSIPTEFNDFWRREIRSKRRIDCLEVLSDNGICLVIYVHKFIVN